MDAPPSLPPPPHQGGPPDLVPEGSVGPEVAPPAPPAAPPLPRPSGLTFFVIVLGLFAALGTAAQASNPVLGLAWSEIFALLLPALLAATGFNLVPERALLLARRPAAPTLALAVVIGGVGFLAAGALMALNSLLVPARWVEAFDVTRAFDRPGLQRTALAVVASTVAPFCEEVVFRGWLLTSLRTRHGTKTALAGAALLFAIMHLDPVRFGALFALGLVYGWLAWRAGSIWPAVVAHVTNNTLGVLLASLGAGEGALHGPRGTTGQIAASAALMLALSGSALTLLAAVYERMTPAPPALSAIVSLRDPADASARYAARRIPPRLLALAVLGGALLIVIVATGQAIRR